MILLFVQSVSQNTYGFMTHILDRETIQAIFEKVLIIFYLYGIDNGLFARQQATGNVEIYTCCAEQIRDDETDHAKRSKQTQNQDSYRKVNQELINRLKKKYPNWQIKLFVKDDPDGIFHARYLETQHAIIRVDRGFDLFKQNGGFRRNFFTLNMAESSHLKECRDLQNAGL